MPVIDYSRLLAHLQEPGGIRVAERDLLEQMQARPTAAEIRALGQKLRDERFVRNLRPQSVGAAQLILRVTMALTASEAQLLVPRLDERHVPHLVRSEQLEEVRQILDRIAFRSRMLMDPKEAESLSRLYGRLAHVSDGTTVLFRRIIFQIAQGVLWLNQKGLRKEASTEERLLYSFELSSEKFWRLRRTRQRPAEWEMLHGRIYVSQSRRNVWDQKEAFQRLRNKILAGYWESATTAGPDTALDSIANLYEDLYEDLLDTLSHSRADQAHTKGVEALWFLLLQKALPVREGTGLGHVTLGAYPTPLQWDRPPV